MGYTHEVVTLWYRAPEVAPLTSSPLQFLISVTGPDGIYTLSTPLDIWSCGCIFAEMATGRPLFPGSSDNDQLYRIFRVLGTPTRESWPSIIETPSFKRGQVLRSCQAMSLAPLGLDDTALDLLTSMIKYEPDHRITAKDALHHP